MEPTGGDASKIPTARGALPYAFLAELPRQGRGGTTQRVQEVIREAIVALSFAPGEFIQKDAICKRLGVSRFPVSEALGRLADEGFVEILPQRGTRVTHIDIASCRQAMFIRRALESEAMRVIASRAREPLIARLEQSLAEQRLSMDRGDSVAFFRDDIAFHDILLTELGYERVRAAVDAARGGLDRTRAFLLRTPQRQQQSYLEHTSIMAALKAGDPAAAHRAMTEHLDRILNELEAHAAKNPQIFAPEP
ncbi:MAG TPA: GntR family transcriptional regulator [Xanthobacteraceae bacterium]|jgi:DNA-binding GntR family transcriptional regulator